jgi:hypothetical protein
MNGPGWDARTIWLVREHIIEAKAVEVSFARVDSYP